MEKIVSTLEKIVLALSVLVITFLPFYGVYQIYDVSGTLETVQAIIVDKDYKPAHRSTMYNSSTKNYVVRNNPERYYLEVSIDNLRKKLKVSEIFFASTSKGDRVDVQIVTGKLSGRVKIISITEN